MKQLSKNLKFIVVKSFKEKFYFSLVINETKSCWNPFFKDLSLLTARKKEKNWMKIHLKKKKPDPKSEKNRARKWEAKYEEWLIK